MIMAVDETALLDAMTTLLALETKPTVPEVMPLCRTILQSLWQWRWR